jgi:hypothetical protein
MEMSDEWRLQVDFREVGHAEALAGRLEAVETEHDLENAYQDRVIVSRDGSRVFLYAGDRGQAEQAQGLIEGLAQQHGWVVECDLRHWHPVAEEWEPPEKPLPQDEAAKRAEREELMARERGETEERGYPEFEALVSLPSHRDASQLAERLAGEGLPCVHRWKYVAVGATDEDSANALAERIRTEAPIGSKVTVQGTPQASYGEYPHPFAFLGGLAG